MVHWRQSQFREEQMPEQLRPVECPSCVMYLWDYFRDMNRRRTSNGYGYNPITEEGVQAWARRRRITLLPFENELLDELEYVFLRIKNKEKAKT
jgi:hypothetical protein